jgi:predicted O-linked N-acetylglucosamine transferase (SPINDLY family)
MVCIDEDDMNIYLDFFNKECFDILIYPDIGMFLPYQLLAYLKLAPIQINTWGHSETSGIDTIDYYISSKYYEKEDAQKFYSEKLIKLDSLCTYYYDRIKLYNYKIGFKAYEFFGLSSLLHIYGVTVSIDKLHPSFMKVISKILSNDNLAVIIFIVEHIAIEKFFEYLKYFIAEKITNIRIFKKQKLYMYFNLINCIDIVLDTFPFGGCNSTIDAFYFNKIVLTLPDEKLSGRFTYGFYKKMNITEPICSSKEEYVEKALFYMNNKEERLKIEKKIADNKHLLFEEQKSIDDWKEMLIKMYNSIPETMDLEKDKVPLIDF